MTDPTVPPLTQAQKAWAGFFISLLLAMAAAVTEPIASGTWTPANTLSVVIAGLTSVGTGLGVYWTPNRPKG